MEFRVKDSHAKAFGSGVPLISFEFLSKNRNAVSINTFTQFSGYLLRFARFASLHLNYISFFPTSTQPTQNDMQSSFWGVSL